MIKATGKARKTRVVVDIDGQQRELFAVEERKNGDVMLYVKWSRQMSTSDGADHEDLTEQRFSIHVSPKSAGHTIKQTVKTSKVTTTTSALVLPNEVRRKTQGGIYPDKEKSFCWPVYMGRPPRLDVGRYDCKPRPADQILSLGAMKPTLSNVVYMVVVTYPNVSTIEEVRGRTRVQTIGFEKFNVHIVYGFSLAPSVPFGDFLTFTTGPQLEEGQAPPSGRRPHRSYGMRAIEGEFFRGIGILRDRYRRHMEEGDPEAQQEQLDFFWTLSAICVPSPPQSGADILPLVDRYNEELASLKKWRSSLLAVVEPDFPDWLKLEFDKNRVVDRQHE